VGTFHPPLTGPFCPPLDTHRRLPRRPEAPARGQARGCLRRLGAPSSVGGRLVRSCHPRPPAPHGWPGLPVRLDGRTANDRPKPCRSTPLTPAPPRPERSLVRFSLRPRGTLRRLALATPSVLPSAQEHSLGAPDMGCFRGSMPSPHAPRIALSHIEGLPTLASRRHRRTATARGRLGSLLPCRMALPSTTLRRLLALLPRTLQNPPQYSTTTRLQRACHLSCSICRVQHPKPSSPCSSPATTSWHDTFGRPGPLLSPTA